MRIGITMHATDRSMDAVELAVEAEQRGFYSFYLPEHTHIPTSRLTPPPTGEKELAEEYLRSPDPYVSLAAAAALSTRIRLGTGVGLPAQHDPITFAKQLATLDRIAEGRLVLGVGFGWNREEMANHGVDFARRREIVREKMLAMQALWRDEVAEFRGHFVDLAPSWQWPKPEQTPRPKTLIGGAAGPKLFDQIAEWADGWIPIGGSGVKDSIGDLKAAFERRGRDPEAVYVAPFGVLPTAGKLDYYRSLGVDEVVLRLPSAGRDEVLVRLDEFGGFL